MSWGWSWFWAQPKGISNFRIKHLYPGTTIGIDIFSKLIKFNPRVFQIKVYKFWKIISIIKNSSSNIHPSNYFFHLKFFYFKNTIFLSESILWRRLGKLVTERKGAWGWGLSRICVFHKPVVPSRQVSCVFPERRKNYSLWQQTLSCYSPKDTGSENSLH